MGDALEQEDKNRQKWVRILTKGVVNVMRDQPEAFLRRARRGIPDDLRLQVWSACLMVPQRRVSGLYDKLSRAENKWTNLISIDVPRTFSSSLNIPSSALQALQHILNAYANLNPEVGYCQGMNFLVGLLIRVVVSQEKDISRSREEDVFWILVCLMDYDGLRDFYREGFPLLLKYTVAFYELLSSECPELSAHFDKEGVSPSLFLHQWYLSLFINCLPFPTVLILWDSIVCDGLPVVLSISLSLLKVLKTVLLKMDFEQIIKFFKTMRNGDEECDAKIIGQLLVKQATMISIPKEVLRSLKSTTPPPSPKKLDPKSSPWSSPIVPSVFTDVPPIGAAVRSPGSPSLFQRVSLAFTWNIGPMAASEDGGPDYQ